VGGSKARERLDAIIGHENLREQLLGVREYLSLDSLTRPTIESSFFYQM